MGNTAALLALALAAFGPVASGVPSPRVGDRSNPSISRPLPAFAVHPPSSSSSARSIGTDRLRIAVPPSIDALFASGDDVGPEGSGTKKEKTLIVIRHGCTYMNEYLSTPGCRWGDAGFTDVFECEEERETMYRDSPLSERGVRQARELSERVAAAMTSGSRDGIKTTTASRGDGGSGLEALRDLDLIAVSPLTRALQTLEIGLLPHLDPAPLPGMEDGVDDGSKKEGDGAEENKSPPSVARPRVPIVALPLATERLYLISDLGKPRSELANRFPYVDFESEFGGSSEGGAAEWWYVPNDSEEEEEEEEWRPNGAGQKYATPGEPEAAFDGRMKALYDWIDSRVERTVALVCHWGVADWLLGVDMDNCEVRAAPFGRLRRGGYATPDEEADEIFSEGERLVTQDMEG